MFPAPETTSVAVERLSVSAVAVTGVVVKLETGDTVVVSVALGNGDAVGSADVPVAATTAVGG